MTTPNPIFEEGTLEFMIVQGLLHHHQAKMNEASFDIYKLFGVLVRGEVNITYRVDDIERFADYIRENDYKFETLEYLPSAFYFDQT